ncbi:MAG TPA: Asp-tRNA(Asn)/Glu-tRNA(Gln) amidotransferase subunit GatA [Anaerolineaceae bacterium]|nr:Asp-tRNA(Asn)/Glu-tRNA(Gln) amidotransferase subunit GatA [Anaerolineaceae bacterium]
MTDLTALTARQALELLDRGDISARELVRACAQRIEQFEPQIHAFITLTTKAALEQAEQADRRRAVARRDGEPVPPLLGLPIAVKDLLAQEGVPCTCGSRILADFVAPYTATSVARLLAAGAISLGRTNMDEFAMGSSTENSAYGPTRNPWDRSRVPGGSSGGSAAAVAARMVPAAVGTDTGGSVRQPAAYCGLTGIKPTYGRVSRYGLVAFGSSLDTVGVLARDAADAALLFGQMAGWDPADATSMDVPVPDLALDGRPSVAGLRVGVPKEYFIAGIQPEVEGAVRAAIAELERLGARPQEISLPHTDFALPVYYLIAPAEASANLARYDGVRYGLRARDANLLTMFKETRGAGFGPEVKRRIMLGTYALSAGYYDAYYGHAQKVRTLIKRDFEAAFEQVDVIAAPVAPSTAFKIGEHSDDPLAMYLEDVFTLPINLAGVPALTFPVGFDSAGLPIGMQLMGPHFGEQALFETAHTYQQATDWHTRKPEKK